MYVPGKIRQCWLASKVEEQSKSFALLVGIGYKAGKLPEEGYWDVFVELC